MIQLKETTLTGKFFEYAEQCIEGKFMLNDGTEEKLKLILATVEQNKHGVCLLGNPGAGKTFIFEVLRRVIHPQDSWHMIKKSCIAIVEDYNVENDRKGGSGDNVLRQPFFRKNIFWDDLMREPKGKYNVDVMTQVLFNADERFRQYSTKSHFTCNFLPDEIKQRYGDWIWSRIQGMCVVVAIEPDQDFRPLKNFKGFPNVFHTKRWTDEERIWNEKYEALKKKGADNEPHKPMGTRFKEMIDSAFAPKIYKQK